MSEFCNETEIITIFSMPLYRQILIYLFLFGIAYTVFVWILNEAGFESAFTSFLVIGGVAVTVLAITLPFLGVTMAVLILSGFTASGTPMVIGSIALYLKERKDAQKEAIKAARSSIDRLKNSE